MSIQGRNIHVPFYIFLFQSRRFRERKRERDEEEEQEKKKYCFGNVDDIKVLRVMEKPAKTFFQHKTSCQHAHL